MSEYHVKELEKLIINIISNQESDIFTLGDVISVKKGKSISLNINASELPIETYSVTFNLSNVSMEYVSIEKMSYETGEHISVKLTTNSGYKLPDSISLSNATIETYNKNTGSLIIIVDGTGNIIVNCTAVVIPAVTYSVTFNLSNVSMEYVTTQKDSYTANEIVSILLTPNDGYKLPDSITCTNATVEKYKKDIGLLKIKVSGTGNVIVNCTAVIIPVNTYTVTFTLANISIEYISTQKETYVANETVSVELTAESGYKLPDSISVTNATYQYNKSSISVGSSIQEKGSLTINVKGTGNVIVDGEGIKINTGTTPIVLNNFLSVYNSEFFTSIMGITINQNSKIYNFLTQSTDYYNEQFDKINWTNIFEDEMDVDDLNADPIYEITKIGIDKEAGFGWFLAYIFTLLYPFRGSDLQSKHRNQEIYQVAFNHYSEVNVDTDYSSFNNTKGLSFLKKYAGSLAASVILARMMSKIMSNETLRQTFMQLKSSSGYKTENSSMIIPSYHFNNGSSFLYEDVYIYKCEEMDFPKRPTNGVDNWVWRRDMRYHDVGGQLRNSGTIGSEALEDRNSHLDRWVTIMSNMNFSKAKFKSFNAINPQNINASASHIDDKVIKKYTILWQNANNAAGHYDEYGRTGFDSYYLGYNKTGHEKFCLLDLGIISGSLMANKLKNHATYNQSGRMVDLSTGNPYPNYVVDTNGNKIYTRVNSSGQTVTTITDSDKQKVYNYYRVRPCRYLSNDIYNASYPNGGYVNGIYYQDSKTGGTSDSSYPSGHTAAGWTFGLLYCSAFADFSDNSNTEDLEKLFRRCYQYGEHRNIVGAHWQQCIDMGRLTACISYALMCGNEYFIDQLKRAQDEN